MPLPRCPACRDRVKNLFVHAAGTIVKVGFACGSCHMVEIDFRLVLAVRNGNSLQRARLARVWAREVRSLVPA